MQINTRSQLEGSRKTEDGAPTYLLTSTRRVHQGPDKTSQELIRMSLKPIFRNVTALHETLNVFRRLINAIVKVTNLFSY